MVNFQSLKSSEIERRRAVIEEQVTKLNVEYLELGKVLDLRRRQEEIERKAATLEARGQELSDEMAALQASSPTPVIIKVNPIIARIFNMGKGG